VKGAHVSNMKDLPIRLVAALVAALAATLATGCTSTGTSGDGNTPRSSRGGGWENFRAQAPDMPPGPAA
jgi:hypothetical protein